MNILFEICGKYNVLSRFLFQFPFISFGMLPVETPQPSLGSATPAFISQTPIESQALEVQAPIKQRVSRMI